MKHAMLDIEALGLSTRCVIIEVGICFFDSETLEVDDEPLSIALPVSPQIEDLKREVNGETLSWWLSDKDRRANFHRMVSRMGGGLGDLQDECRGIRDRLEGCKGIWGNGSNYDNAAILDLFKQMGVKEWDYRANRCFRTLKCQWPDVPPPVADETQLHRGGYDAQLQAQHLMMICRSRGPASMSLSGSLG